ncbi:MAG TPA: nucleoside-diphosphate sugar epimerase/dehydratase, partial [Nocardioidaceae bacterium]
MSDAIVNRVRLRRLFVLAAFDAFAWMAAVLLFTLVRYAAVAAMPWEKALKLGLTAVVLHTVFGLVVRLHQGRAGLGSFEEMILLGSVTAIVGTIISIGNIAAGPQLPRGVPVAATFISLVLMAWGRAVYRRIRESTEAELHEGKVPALILGAGAGGRLLINSMLGQRDTAMVPVGLVDDDPLKRHLRIRGIPVVGTSTQLANAADETGATTVIIAIPSADAECVRELSQRVREAGLDVKVVPSANELLTSRADISDVRDIDVTDLLGRHQIDTDLGSIADYLSGKRVLVTGAGGSIGSELCRQIAKFSPSELIMLDRDESALHAVQLSIYGKAMLDSDDVVLADIRDVQFINQLFEDRRPQVVFHAAALKHLPMLEQYPGEAVKSNVWGTLSVLEAARENNVEKFVNISTDKAANPTSVLGYSKRLAEALTAAIAPEAAGTFVSVRFGNVLGSRGSVLTAFASQIAAGGPVTVTHPEVTRYFRTVQEAVQLVIQAAAIGRDGEALVLDMGEPVS